mgnify:CR=1 FL=1
MITSKAGPVRFDDIFGYVKLTEAGPWVYGQQPPATIYERFDRQGALVERRVIPPAIHIDYGGQD